jgi:DNA-binding NarL/FixJ family response regulator
MSESPYRDSTDRARVRLMIADDHESVRQGLRALFASSEGVDIVAEAGDTDEVLARVQSLPLDVVVMDLSMPPLGGLAAIRVIKAEKPGIEVVVLTRYSDSSFVREALAAGASGYVLKQSSFTELRQAVEAVGRREQYFDRQVAAAVERLGGEVTEAASGRERDVLRRAALGQSNKEIAEALAISVRTVEVHKTRGMRKLALRDRRELVRYASVQGWLTET